MRINGAGRFHQNQDGRLLIQRTCQDRALPLTAGKRPPPLGDMPVQSFRQRFQNIMGVRGAQSGQHLFIAIRLGGRFGEKGSDISVRRQDVNNLLAYFARLNIGSIRTEQPGTQGAGK